MGIDLGKRELQACRLKADGKVEYLKFKTDNVSAKQVAYYSGLVPRVDISGDCVRYGPITKRGAHLFRRPLIQAAWSLVRSPHGGTYRVEISRPFTRGFT